MAKALKILVVDDSTFMRKILTKTINSDPEFRVIKTAGDGVEALKAVEIFKPDVITMDLELPEIDGLTCIAYIMEKYPTPIIVVTGYSEFMGAETLKALEYGAVDFLRKPIKKMSLDLESLKQALLEKIKLASLVDVTKLRPIKTKKTQKKKRIHSPQTTSKIVAIASSSGGPRALGQLIPMLPAGLPAGVVVVQHIPHEFVFSLAARLDWESALEVKVAEDGEPILNGKVYIMPQDVYCTIVSQGNKGELIKTTPFSEKAIHPFNSMANKLMISTAPIYGKNAIGVVLTGMGNDGTEGLRAIKQHGGFTIAEHESSCIVFGMPKSAIQAGVVDRVIPLKKIANEIVAAVTK